MEYLSFSNDSKGGGPWLAISRLGTRLMAFPEGAEGEKVHESAWS